MRTCPSCFLFDSIHPRKFSLFEFYYPMPEFNDILTTKKSIGSLPSSSELTGHHAITSPDHGIYQTKKNGFFFFILYTPPVFTAAKRSPNADMPRSKLIRSRHAYIKIYTAAQNTAPFADMYFTSLLSVRSVSVLSG